MTSIQDLWRYSTCIQTNLRVINPYNSETFVYFFVRKRGSRTGYKGKIINFFKRSGRGDVKILQWISNSELHKLMIDIQTIHAKLDSQDGNSREQESRSLMIIK
jgi:hypothetical protein